MRACWSVLLLACVQTPVDKGPQTGSETHWLQACGDDTDCSDPGSTCFCSICTRPCEADAICAGVLAGAVCAQAGSAEAEALCGAVPAEAGVCVASCAEGGCAEGLACVDGVCAAAGEPRGRAVVERSVVVEHSSLDLLFVIDDSGSMCEEQRALADTFATLADSGFFTNLDYRLAVVSTDMHPPNEAMGRFLARPAEPVPSLNCRDPETAEPVAPDTAHCADLELEPILGSHQGLDATQTAEHFRCLATLGTNGDGFERGLEAMRVALSCDGPNAARFGDCCQDGRYDAARCASPDFLRPDAALVVIIVSDEDDCSDPASNPGASRKAICKYGVVDDDEDGVPNGYDDPELCADLSPEACYAAECDALDAEACRLQRCTISRSTNSNCAWEASILTPVGDYVRFLRGLKGGDVRALTFVGDDLLDEEGRPVHFVPGPAVSEACDPDSDAFDPAAPLSECCPNGRCPGSIRPTCERDYGLAFPGTRYRSLSTALEPAPCEVCSLCREQLDFEPLMALAEASNAWHCLDEEPVCTVVESALLRACEGEELVDPAHRAVWVELDGAPLPAEGWALVEAEACSGGWAVQLASEPAPEAQLRIRYRTER